MNLGRWLLALPIAIAASFLAHIFSNFAFGLGDGFYQVEKIWAANDMAGMPIMGSLIIFFTRAVTTFAFIFVLVYVVPKHKQKIAFVASALVIVFAVGLIGFGIYESELGVLNISVVGWYRDGLESVAYCAGGLFGFGAAKDAQCFA